MSGQTEVTLPSVVSYHSCSDAEFLTAQSTVMEASSPHPHPYPWGLLERHPMPERNQFSAVATMMNVASPVHSAFHFISACNWDL